MGPRTRRGANGYTRFANRFLNRNIFFLITGAFQAIIVSIMISKASTGDKES